MTVLGFCCKIYSTTSVGWGVRPDTCLRENYNLTHSLNVTFAQGQVCCMVKLKLTTSLFPSVKATDCSEIAPWKSALPTFHL